jgi:hypothetical protein
MPRHLSILLWEGKEQAEYRATKARFFRLLAVILTILSVLAVQLFYLL